MKYYILIKRKTGKNWTGAFKVKPNISLATIRSLARKQIKPSFSYKIITEKQFKSMKRPMIKKKSTKKKTVKRKVAKKKTVKRRKK